MVSQQSIVWWWVKVFIFTIHPGAEFSVWSLNHPVLPRVFNQLHQIHQASANSKETLLVCGAVPLWHHEGIRWNHQSSSNFFPCQRSLLDKICSQTLSLHSTKGSCQTQWMLHPLSRSLHLRRTRSEIISILFFNKNHIYVETSRHRWSAFFWHSLKFEENSSTFSFFRKLWGSPGQSQAWYLSLRSGASQRQMG